MEPINLLLVDDEESLISTMAERLALRGLSATTASSGVDALRRLGEEKFDVLILDVKMPGIGGLELMAEAKREHPDLPVILFTGHGSAVDAERGMAAGAFDYIMKPVDIDVLIAKVRSAAGTAGERES